MPAVPDPDRERSGSGVPLPPEDRLWRHPSEFGGSGPGDAFPPESPEEPRRRRRSVVAVAAIAGFIGAVVAVAGLAAGGVLRPRVVEKVERDASTVEASSAVEDVSSLAPMGVAALARKARTSVLRVEVSDPAGGRRGSAVVYRADGVLLTSATLVEGAAAVSVALADGRPSNARVVASDPVSGLAVLQLDATGLQTTGSSRGTDVGDPAVTLAGPTDLAGQPSVTVGVVSALGVETASGDRAMRDLVQIDRPVPAAADGGMVLDADGRMIGIALDLESDQADDDALGHVVPATTARKVAEELLDHGRVRRAWLGVEGTELSSGRASELDVPGGVVIERINPGSPAEAAGLVPGDVIVAVGGRAVRSVGELVVAIQHAEVGTDVRVAFVRDRAEATVSATMEEPPG